MKSLRATLAYKNPGLMLRIQKALTTNRPETQRIYSDVMTWLWLCSRHRVVRRSTETSSCGYQLNYLPMLEHFRAIDYGWHEFILMTKDYQQFCDQYCDGYIHHEPAPLDPKTLEKVGRVQPTEFWSNYLSFIADEVGPPRLERWLKHLPAVT